MIDEELMRPHGLTGIFARTLRSKPEDAITEVLAALLRSETVGSEVLKALLEDRKESPEHVATQYLGGDDSRPDLVLYWSGEAVVIEVKFSAPVQPAQRTGYRKVLKQLTREHGRATLYFLAPARRQKEIESEIEAESGFISWEGVVKALADITQGTATERVWLQELIAAIRQEALIMNPPRKFTPNEIQTLNSQETAPAISNCLTLVEALRDRLQSSKDKECFSTNNSKCYEASGKEFSYGFEVKPVAGVEGWVGFHMQAWRLGALKQPGEPPRHSPIGIELWRTRDDNILPVIDWPGARLVIEEQRSKSLWIPLDLSDEDPGALVDALQSQLSAIYKRLSRK